MLYDEIIFRPNNLYSTNAIKYPFRRFTHFHYYCYLIYLIAEHMKLMFVLLNNVYYCGATSLEKWKCIFCVLDTITISYLKRKLLHRADHRTIFTFCLVSIVFTNGYYAGCLKNGCWILLLKEFRIYMFLAIIEIYYRSMYIYSFK